MSTLLSDIQTAKLAEEVAALVERSLRENPTIPIEYLSEEQVSRMTGFAPRALEAMRYREEGPPFFRVGRSIRYRAADVRAWIEGGASK